MKEAATAAEAGSLPPAPSPAAHSSTSFRLPAAIIPPSTPSHLSRPIPSLLSMAYRSGRLPVLQSGSGPRPVKRGGRSVRREAVGRRGSESSTAARQCKVLNLCIPLPTSQPLGGEQCGLEEGEERRGGMPRRLDRPIPHFQMLQLLAFNGPHQFTPSQPHQLTPASPETIGCLSDSPLQASAFLGYLANQRLAIPSPALTNHIQAHPSTAYPDLCLSSQRLHTPHFSHSGEKPDKPRNVCVSRTRRRLALRAVYPDPTTSCPASFRHRLAQLSALETSTVQWERRRGRGRSSGHTLSNKSL